MIPRQTDDESVQSATRCNEGNQPSTSFVPAIGRVGNRTRRTWARPGELTTDGSQEDS